MNPDEEVSRRKVLAMMGAGATSVAGCLGGGPDDGTPTSTSVDEDDIEPLPETYDELNQAFEDLEETRVSENFFLDSSIDTRDGGSHYQWGVPITDNVVLASRDIEDQEILRLEGDQEEYVWYPNSIPRVGEKFQSVTETMREEGIASLMDEKLGDRNGSPGHTVLEDYLQSAASEFQQLAPFVRLSPHSEPIFSDDTIQNVRTARERLQGVKDNYRGLLFGPNNVGAIDNINQTVQEGNYSIRAKNKFETLHDNVLQRYAGLTLLDEVYEDTVELLEMGQDLAEEGTFNERGEPTDTPGDTPTETETPTETDEPTDTPTDTPDEETPTDTPEETDTPDEETPTDTPEETDTPDGNGYEWREFSATYDHRGGIQENVVGYGDEPGLLGDKGKEGLYDLFARFLDNYIDDREVNGSIPEDDEDWITKLVPEDEVERIDDGKSFSTDYLESFFGGGAAPPEGDVVGFEFGGEVKVPEGEDDDYDHWELEDQDLDYIDMDVLKEYDDHEETRTMNMGDEDDFESYVMDYFKDQNLEIEVG